jgi:hypothetical protein
VAAERLGRQAQACKVTWVLQVVDVGWRGVDDASCERRLAGLSRTGEQHDGRSGECRMELLLGVLTTDHHRAGVLLQFKHYVFVIHG